MRLKGLWQNSDFRRLWAGQSLSMLGTNMVAVTVPLIAAVTFAATAFEMGLLIAVEFLPYLLISLFVGVWLDRRPKRTTIVLADAVRAAVLLAVPVMWWTETLNVPGLLAVAFCVGACSVIADIGCASILPDLIDRSDLVEGNSKLEVSSSVSNMGGMTVGGLLVQLFGGPIVMFINVFTFGLAAVAMSRIRSREAPPPQLPTEQSSMWRDIGEGLRFIFGDRTVRTLVIVAFLLNFSALAIDPVFLVFIARTLGLPGVLVGVLLAASGVGALLGALLSTWLSRRMTFGTLVVATVTAMAAVEMAIPIATVMPKAAAFGVLLLIQLSYAALVIAVNVNIRSYRTAVTPDELQGRMNASARMLVMAGAPFGAVLGGTLGSLLGTQWAMVTCASGLLIAAVMLGLSPVRKVKAIPERAPAPVGLETAIGSAP